jgi:hypothetical protein
VIDPFEVGRVNVGGTYDEAVEGRAVKLVCAPVESVPVVMVSIPPLVVLSV